MSILVSWKTEFRLSRCWREGGGGGGRYEATLQTKMLSYEESQ